MFAFLMIFAAAGYGSITSYAYLADQEQTDNITKPAQNVIHIQEDFVPPQDPGPGSVIPKKPKVINDSNIPVYVRMRYQFSDSDAEAFCEPLQIHRNWTLKEDGFYYFAHLLNPGESTDALFEKIQIKSNIAKNKLIPFDLSVYAESIQANIDSDLADWTAY